MVSFFLEALELGRNRKYWIGLAVSVVLLALFLLTVDVRGMLTAIGDANYVFVVPAVAMYLVSILFRSLRWQTLLKHMRPVKVTRLYPVVVVGYMANNLLPMRMGELVRSYYVGEREGISKTSALVTIFIERLLDALTLLMFIAAIALFVPLIGLAEGFSEKSGVAWPLLVIAVSLPFVAAFGGLLFVALVPSKARAASTVLLSPLPGTLAGRLGRFVDLFLDGLSPLRSPGTILVLFLLSIPIWLFEAALFFLIGFSFDLHQVYDGPGELAVAAVLVTSLANIGSSVPAAPGGLGLFEIVARETLVLLPLATVDRAVAGGYVAVVHAALLLPMIILGQVFLWTQHLSLAGLSRSGQPDGTEMSNEGTPAGSTPAVTTVSVEAEKRE